eukprot:g47300.t1
MVAANQPNVSSTKLRFGEDLSDNQCVLPKVHSFHTAGQIAFRSFLMTEFSEENINFWLACEDYKKIKCPTKLACEAKKIYTKFIKVEAPEE